MTLLMTAIAFVIAALSAWAATRTLIPHLKRNGFVDVPNGRSSHTDSTPRGGGVGILAGVSAGLATFFFLGAPMPEWPLLAGAGIVALSGFLDDRFGGLPVLLRFGTHLFAAALVVFTLGGIPTLPLPMPLDLTSGVLAFPLGLVWIVAVTNLYNFLDGIDGFAASQGVIAGCGLALIAPESAGVLGIILAASCTGFLVHNWHPARVFLGDVGSTTIGFLLATAPFGLDPLDRPPIIFAAAILLWFFLADGVFTLIRRLINGDKVWEAHRSHLYQRLVITGLRHDTVTLIVQSATVILALSMVAATRSESPVAEWFVLATASIAFLGYTLYTIHREKFLLADQAI